MASGESVGGHSVGSKEGLTLALQAGKIGSRWRLGVSTPGRPATCQTVAVKRLFSARATS